MHKSIWVLSLPAVFLVGCVLPPLALPQATPTFPPPSVPVPTAVVTDIPTMVPMLVYSDIPYETIADIDPNLISLDIYTPLLMTESDEPRPVNPFPVLVFIHGGSWSTGDKNGTGVASVQAPYFTSQGVIYVSINYRLAPSDRFPTPVEDVAAALRWVYSDIGNYGGDPQRIYIMGHSAGGQLAALVATDEHYLVDDGLNLGILRGVILLDGVGLDIPREISSSTLPMFTHAFGSDPGTWQDASPLSHIYAGKGIPAFLIFYATVDGKSLKTSPEIAEALTDAGVQNWLVAAKGKAHDTILNDIGTAGDPETRRIMDFVQASKP